jgi:hypothetical protein
MTGAKHVDLVLKDKLNSCAQQFTESIGKRLRIMLLVTGRSS